MQNFKAVYMLLEQFYKNLQNCQLLEVDFAMC